MFSFLYRGFAVVVFLSALIHCLTKSSSAVPTAAMMRRTPKKTTGPANHIAYNPRKPQRGFFWTFVVFALTYNYISSSCGFFCVSVVPRRCHLITKTYLWYWIQLVVFFFSFVQMPLKKSRENLRLQASKSFCGFRNSWARLAQAFSLSNSRRSPPTHPLSLLSLPSLKL